MFPNVFLNADEMLLDLGNERGLCLLREPVLQSILELLGLEQRYVAECADYSVGLIHLQGDLFYTELRVHIIPFSSDLFFRSEDNVGCSNGPPKRDYFQVL